MQALFVHGMGHSPLSGWPLLRQLRRAGWRTGSFGYFATVQDFAAIRQRLAERIQALAAAGDYVLIGHSLGGILIRAALNALPAGTRPPRHVFLLASPQTAVRLARGLQRNLLYRLVTRDCGQLLSSQERMAAVGPVAVPTTSIAGVAGPLSRHTPFRGEPNDGIVALSEVSATWITDAVQLPKLHTFLPMSRHVARIILDRLAAEPSARDGGA